MLERNLAALREAFPKLAETIEATEPSPKITLFFGPNEDVNMAYDGIALHRIEDPIGEALEVFEAGVPEQARGDQGIVFIYGLGLGYLLRRTFINTKAQIIVFEPYPEVLRQTLEAVDLSQELGSNRVSIVTSLDSIPASFAQRYLLGDAFQIIALPAYQSTNPEKFLAILDELKSSLFLSIVGQNTALLMMEEYTRSSLENLPIFLQYPEFDCLHQQFQGVPGVVVSAGPSLDKPGVMDMLKAHRDHLVISCVGQAAKALDKAGIVPDFINILETRDIRHQLEGVSYLERSNLILLPQTHKSIFEYPTKRKFISHSSRDALTRWLSKALKKPLRSYNHQGTVSISAMLHLMSMGCSPIFLVGQDLAYPEGKMYSQNSVYKGWEFVVTEDGKKDVKAENKEEFFGAYGFYDGQAGWEAAKRRYISTLIETKGWQGETLYTNPSYESFRKSFEIIIKSNRDYQVVNCSEGGAYIDGCEHMPFVEAMNHYLTKPDLPKPELEKHLVEKYVECPQYSDIYQTVYNQYVEDREDLRYAKTLIHQGEAAVKKIMDELESKKTITHSIQSRLKKLDALEVSLQQIIQQNALINCFINQDMMQYNKQYGRKIHLEDASGLVGDVDAMQENLEYTTFLYQVIRKGIQRYVEVMDPIFEAFPAYNKVQLDDMALDDILASDSVSAPS